MSPRSASPRTHRSYEPLEWFVVRAPLLPVDRYELLSTEPPGEASPVADPLVRRAVEVASPALLHALDPRAGEGRAKTDQSARSALLRYLIRMSTRPTPYGLFAGVGIGNWGERTNLEIASTSRPTHTRPDMGWLTGWMLALEADPDVRPFLRLAANTCAFERDGRLHLTDRSTGGRTGLPDVSVRATPVVRRVLSLARTAVAYDELVHQVLASTPGATRETETKVHGLLAELLRQDLLLSDLRPPLAGDPVRHAVTRLTAIPAHRDAGEELASLVADATAIDTTAIDTTATETARDDADPTADTTRSLAGLRDRLRSLHDPGEQELLQVDSALPLAGREVSRSVAAEVARAAELLLRMHPRPHGPSHLANYRAAFLSRYGHDRRVPLLELLDPRFGLGPPTSAHSHDANQMASQQRSQLLMELATTALRTGSLEVVLDEEDVEKLSTWTPEPDRLPASLELSAFLLAPSVAALDQGDYLLVVGPNLGGQAAGRGLGRFAGLLGEPAQERLVEIARAEETLEAGVTAELVYLPARHRSANVAVRPRVRHFEIPVGVAPGVDPDRVIPPDELEVMVRAGRLALWWPAGDTEVHVSAGHMLNTASAPQVCRFLHDVGGDAMAALMPFDWGPANGLPFVPRVRSGRVVLRPAEWRWPRRRAADALRVDDAVGFAVALKRWREEWLVPRHVYLTVGDNRLLLDLDDAAHADQIREMLRRERGSDLVLQEALPGPDTAWLPGPGGRYASELVVPLLRRSSPPPATKAPSREPLPARVDDVHRLRPPGTDWLYLTLYGPATGEDVLLAGHVREFTERLVGDGDADRWFFLRYSDPGRHLRLRLHGSPEVLTARALPRVTTWAAGLVAAGKLTRIGLEVYERELERYGGPEAMEVCEQVFAVDSAATAELLGLTAGRDAPVEPLELAALSFDTLLAGLGLDEAARTAWYAENPAPPRESGAAYRERKDRLRALLAGEADVLGPSHQQIRAVFDRRTDALGELGARLERLHREGRCTLPVSALAHSFVHLNGNRLGVTPSTERLVLGLLRRTRASLAKAPLRRVDGGG
ncbi:lantibiotic dehydratase [Actinopolymorpha pittospori]|uniref:Thiopeptide-type bacteriocin biosynthesis protein n=1 Tax=Actinopolymorpha pittospori TaxID=648752 RepID=A0A927N000_9ACTN|nr:lantibiotic dehydratase [Actinopolymorpha pittospori]MBE1610101.1 thiopeptide-type bacteriocin biosynthesis protein [Actinopolymorpha pittospori]